MTHEARAQDPAYLAEYKLYTEALEKGDNPSAARHGRAAWLDAEETLGDDRLTAILAYNYGRLVIFNDSEGAHEALLRVQELQEAGISDLPAAEADAYVAFAQFIVSGKTWGRSRRLRKTLKAVAEIPDLDQNPDWGPMWLQLAAADMGAERYSKAKEGALRAEATLDAAPHSNNDYYKAQSLLIAGVSTLMPRPRDIRQTVAAREYLTRAQALFPPQESIDTLDPALAQVLAWNAAAGATLMSLSKRAYAKQQDLESEETSTIQFFKHEKKDDEECEIEWEERKPPNYPAEALMEGYIGGVIVGYRLGEGLRVKDARILSEVPRASFGAFALKSMESWRLKKPALDHPACRSNRLAQFTFAID